MIRLGAAVCIVVLFSLTIAYPGYAVTITFETRPDGTPIQDQPPGVCHEITFETFRPWGVLFTPSNEDILNIQTTLIEECGFSEPNSLGVCSQDGMQDGTINITFVLSNTDISTVVDRVQLTMWSNTYAQWQGRVNTYDAQATLLDSWTFYAGGFCREPPAYYDHYDFSAPGRIARVECIFLNVGIDDFTVTEASTPVEETTWSRIKTIYR